MKEIFFFARPPALELCVCGVELVPRTYPARMGLEVSGPTPSGKPTCEEASPAQRPYWDRWSSSWPLDLELGTKPSHAVALERCQGWPINTQYLKFIILHKLKVAVRNNLHCGVRLARKYKRHRSLDCGTCLSLGSSSAYDASGTERSATFGRTD